MTYLISFLRANAKQLGIIALSAGNVYLALYHPEWKGYEMKGFAVLAMLGFHVDSIVYKRDAILIRLAKKKT